MLRVSVVSAVFLLNVQKVGRFLTQNAKFSNISTANVLCTLLTAQIRTYAKIFPILPPKFPHIARFCLLNDFLNLSARSR